MNNKRKNIERSDTSSTISSSSGSSISSYVETDILSETDEKDHKKILKNKNNNLSGKQFLVI